MVEIENSCSWLGGSNGGQQEFDPGSFSCPNYNNAFGRVQEILD